MDRGGTDPFAGLKEASEEYKVYDSHYEKIGKVDDLVADGNDRVLYIGVKMGFFGTNSTLIPTEIIRINDKRRLIEVSEPAETIKHGPHFGRSEELTPELENHVRTYFGLEDLRSSAEHAPQGPDILETPPAQLDADTRATSQERSAPPPASAPQEEKEHEPERVSEQEPISERLSEEPKHLIDRLRTGSGVTVHRMRR